MPKKSGLEQLRTRDPAMYDKYIFEEELEGLEGILLMLQQKKHMKTTEEAHLNNLLIIHFDALTQKDSISSTTIKEGARLLENLFEIRSLAAHHKVVVMLLDACIEKSLEHLSSPLSLEEINKIVQAAEER